jgi:hypothetical protein
MFACLLIPDFPVQAALRLEPKDTREALRQSPIACELLLRQCEPPL